MVWNKKIRQENKFIWIAEQDWEPCLKINGLNQTNGISLNWETQKTCTLWVSVCTNIRRETELLTLTKQIQ